MAAYLRPATLTDALTLRAGNSLTVLAGGTDIYPARAARVGWGDMRQPDILDISAIGELRGISEAADHWRLGALTTWTDLIRADLPPLFDGIRQAAHEVGGAQIQNRGTLAGNICTASPAGDGAPNLLAREGGVELASVAGRRVVPMAQFIDGYRHTVCRADEIVTAILVRKPAARRSVRSGFVKLGARKYLVISIVMVAGVLETDDAGLVAAARLAVGACSTVPQRLPALEQALVGLRPEACAALVAEPHVAHLAPIDDIRASADYRRAAAITIVRDLLDELARAPQRRAA